VSPASGLDKPGGVRTAADWLTDRVRALTWRDVLPGVPEVKAQARTVWRKDVLVGVSVAAVAIPASLGMADLAGLAPTAGLYATMFPLVAYALIGSSRKLVVGPDGALSSLTASSVAPLAAGAADRYAALAAGLALLTGLVMLAAALLRLGFMADFLSKPVLIGYFNGVALTIIGGQAGKLVGVKTTSSKFFPQLWELITHLGTASVVTAGLSAALIALVLVVRWLVPKAPSALIVVVGATIASAALDLAAHGVSTVGHVSGGIPLPRLPHMTFGQASTLALAAAGMALVSFGDVIATTRTYAARDGYEISPGRELSGLGAANLVAAVTHGQPVSSSGSRTAVLDAAGGRSQVAGVTIAALALLVALFATPLLTDLPKAALGVVLVFAALGMISARGVVRLRRVHDTEAALALATMLAVLVFGVLGGLLIAVALSIGVFVYRSVRPHDAVLGESADVDGWHDVGRMRNPQTLPGLVVYRFDAPLFFPNALYFKDQVRQTLAAPQDESGDEDGGGSDPRVTWLLVNAEAMVYLDSTAEQMLRDLHAELAEQGVTLAFARVKGHIREILDSSGLTEIVGTEYFFSSVRAGAEAFRNRGPR